MLVRRNIVHTKPQTGFETFVLSTPLIHASFCPKQLQVATTKAYAASRSAAFGKKTPQMQEDAAEFLWKLWKEGELDTTLANYTKVEDSNKKIVSASYNLKGEQYTVTNPHTIRRALLLVKTLRQGEYMAIDETLGLTTTTLCPSAVVLDKQVATQARPSTRHLINMVVVPDAKCPQNVCRILEDSWLKPMRTANKVSVMAQITVVEECWEVSKTTNMFLWVQFLCTSTQRRSAWDVSGTSTLNGSQYTPLAVVSYSGNGVSGHYTAFRNTRAGWWEYDDVKNGCNNPKPAPGGPTGFPSLVLFCKSCFF